MFASTPFLSDGNTRKIRGQRIYPGSSNHSNVLYRTKDASDNHTDFTCHQRGKWPGWRLGNPPQLFPLYLFSCLSISIWNQFQYVGWHLEEHSPAGTLQIVLLGFRSYSNNLHLMHLDIGNEMTIVVQAHRIDNFSCGLFLLGFIFYYVQKCLCLNN